MNRAENRNENETERGLAMSKKDKKTLIRIIIGAVLYATMIICDKTGVFGFIPESLDRLVMLFYLIPYVVVGYDVVGRAFRNISHGQVFDENFLMMIATFGAFGVEEYPEAVAVMLLYQIGEMFQDYAVGKSRKSISDMMDIVPEYANVEENGELVQVDPEEVGIGTVIVIKPGEKIPLDGVVTEGESMLDTAALTGESVPRTVRIGDEVYSGCVNQNAILRVKTTKAFDDSTVAKILEMVENASEKKSHTENFITRFARYYTPVVTILAAALALLVPLVNGFMGDWTTWYTWIKTACTLLVISCPCALVISVPLGFFGGIGAASKLGVLVKGSNYLETVADLDTVVFDKTGTLTKGEFAVSALYPSEGLLQSMRTEDETLSQTEVLQQAEKTLLTLAAYGEAYSNHPIAASIREAYGETVQTDRLGNVEEISGHGTKAMLEGKCVLCGNDKLMESEGISYEACKDMGTIVYVACDGSYAGAVVISDAMKDGVKDAIGTMKQVGIAKTVMLTGDRREVAEHVAQEVGIDEVHAELLPQNKVEEVERLLSQEQAGRKLGFVGDGINDAPVLTRADVGFAMGSMGSDAAIEAADVVIMDDDVRKIASIVKIARKTIKIVKENIVFSLAIKAMVLILGIFNSVMVMLGTPLALDNVIMYFAIFADVGVCTLAILNSMRTMRMK